MKKECINCGKIKKTDYWTIDADGTWWHLTGYYSIFGLFCPKCFRKVAHDSYGNPENHKEYLAIAVKQRLERANAIPNKGFAG